MNDDHQRPETASADDPDSPKVVPLSANARRVLGVLVEKAKTTPDSYPLTAAGLIAGSNQKSNRSPKMELDEGDVLLALDELRRVGAAREVHGSGRVIKYRHSAYDWLNVDGPGSAVMTELLLRGPQTVGELRTRASRMHELPDLAATSQVIEQLVEKGLVEAMTPPGRGQLFAHTLYTPHEKQHLYARIDKQIEVPSPGPTPAESKDVVDQLLGRLDEVNQRIDSLEKRIAELES